MKASELNASHIGKRVSFNASGFLLDDVLVAVHHAADLIDARTITDPDPQWVLGRTNTELTFLNAHEVGVSPSLEVQVRE